MRAIEEWRTWARERGLSESTVRTYGHELEVLQAHHGGLGDLGSAEIASWIRARGGQDQTVARRHSALRSYYGFLVKTGRRMDDPMATVPRPKVTPAQPRPVFDAELRIVERLGEPFNWIARLVLETGITLSEALSIDAANPKVTEVRVVGRKNRERVVPLTREARDALNRLGGRITTSGRTIQRRFREAGFSPHRLRHTVGAELGEQGLDVGTIQQVLGHRAPTTARPYVAFGPPTSTARLREVLERRSYRGRN